MFKTAGMQIQLNHSVSLYHVCEDHATPVGKFLFLIPSLKLYLGWRQKKGKLF